VAVNADGLSVDYTPAANFNGKETVTYTVSDGVLTDATGILIINVTAVNDAPVAVANSRTVEEDSTKTSTDVIANDTDVDGDTLSLTAVSTAGTGTVAVNADGLSVDYTPAADFYGTETITYTVSDGTLTDATGTFIITVTEVNSSAPVAINDTATVEENSGLSSTNVIANDTDIDGDTLSLTAVSTAGTGTVAVNADGLSVDYTPATNFYGTETITYIVSDGTLTDSGTLTITVTEVNFAPVAVNDTASLDEDSTKTSTNVIANDTDVDGDTLSLTSASTAGTGTVAVNADGLSVDYTPGANFNGTETITYIVSDGSLTGTGTLTMTVAGVNDAPVASAQSVTTVEDILLVITLTGTDIESDALTYLVAANPTNGTITLDEDKVTYVPNAGYFGEDSFTFKANDGVLDSSQATVSISVTSNDLDEDGILNDVDDCPNTPQGDIVDIKGCTVFNLPINNNKVFITSATCIGSNDGTLLLSIEDNSFDYFIRVNKKSNNSNEDFSKIYPIAGIDKTVLAEKLFRGTYTVCFNVVGQEAYEQCFEVVIGEPKSLSAFIDVDNDKKTTSIQLSGSQLYNIEVNGQRFEVKGDNFTTSLPTGLNIIKISTNLDCQGVIEKEVFISEDIHYYPNPTPSDVSVHVSGEDTRVLVSVFSEKGDLIYSKEQQIQDFSRKTNIDLSLQITGTYLVVMEGPTVRKTFKIVKK
jgi:hypothetical protein